MENGIKRRQKKNNQNERQIDKKKTTIDSVDSETSFDGFGRQCAFGIGAHFTSHSKVLFSLLLGFFFHICLMI